MLKYLLQKEFLQIRRNPTLIRMILVLPIIQLMILPWAANFEQKNCSICIIDHSRSSYSQLLQQQILGSGFFILKNYTDSYQQALQSVEKNESDLILEIPSQFEPNLVQSSSSALMLTINAVNGQKAGIGAQYLTQIVNNFNQQIVTQIHSPQTPFIASVKVDSYFKFNTELNYRNFMVPGILGMLLTLIGCMLSSLNIVKEKELGTIEQINVSPVPKYIFILAKLIPFWIIGLFLLTLGIGIAWLVYGIFPLGSVIALYLFAFVYLLATTGMGLLISTYSETQQQAMFVLFFFIMIFFMLSGLFTPISSMPNWAQSITQLNPIRYFVEVMRLIYMKGASFFHIIPQFKAMCCFAIFFNIWAIWNYKKTS